MQAPKLIITLVALLALAPGASAASVESTIWLHDLGAEGGAYFGCHVTDEGFGTYRLVVEEGTIINLTIRSYENNTKVHTVSIRSAEPIEETVRSGEGVTVEFTADQAGSYPVLCDGEQDSLSGQIVVRPGQESSNGVPALSLLVTVLAVAAVALARRR